MAEMTIETREASEQDTRSDFEETTYLAAIREAMWEEMKTDPAVFIMG